MPRPTLTIYHDGSCPLCRLEVAHYRRQDGAEHIAFVDVSAPDAAVPGITRTHAMARLHVKLDTGEIKSGASGFVSIWERLPRWRWAARLAQLPGMLTVLELAYTMFLPVRPLLARIVKAIRTRD